MSIGFFLEPTKKGLKMVFWNVFLAPIWPPLEHFFPTKKLLMEDFKIFFRYFMKKLLKVFEDIESRTKTKNHFSRTNKNFVTKKLVRNFFFRLSKISTTPPVCLTSGRGEGDP